MRQRESLTPVQERELDALDRALAGETVDYDLREFDDLVADIRATAPEMSPGFAARLEQQVSEGFPAADAPAARRRRRRFVLIPAGGCLAAALVALVVVIGQQGETEFSNFAARDSVPIPASGEVLESAPDDARRNAAPAPSPLSAPPAASGAAQDSAGASTAARAAPAPPAAVGKAGGERKQQRSADLVLRVPNTRVQAAADNVIRVVDRFGGIVASSQSSKEGRHAEASFDLRIPTQRLDEALAALSKLGNVASRNQALVDITGSFTSAQDRLSDARAERRGLLRALGSATTQQQIDSLRARLRTVRSQIARLNGELDALRRRANLSVVTVSVTGTEASQEDDGEGGGGWSPGDAARDAVRVLEVIAGVLLVSLAVLAPLALLAGLVALGVRAGRRRRRESALDPA